MNLEYIRVDAQKFRGIMYSVVCLNDWYIYINEFDRVLPMIIVMPTLLSLPVNLKNIPHL